MGMDAATEVEWRAGEIIAIAVAEDTEFEGWKQRHFHRAGQVDGSPGGSYGVVGGSLPRGGSTGGNYLEIEGDDRGHHPLIRAGPDDIPRAGRVYSRSAASICTDLVIP